MKKRIKMKNSQIALEFVIFIALGMLFLLIKIPFAINKNSEISQDKRYMKIGELADYIENEVYLASIVEDGYSRTFNIQNSLDGYPLFIQQNSTYVKISTEKESKIFRISEINGTLKIGNNNIRKEGGIVYVS